MKERLKTKTINLLLIQLWKSRKYKNIYHWLSLNGGFYIFSYCFKIFSNCFIFKKLNALKKIYHHGNNYAFWWKAWKKHTQIRRGIYSRVGGIITHVPDLDFLSESVSHLVMWLFATPWTVALQAPHGILQARTLEKVTTAFSRRSSQPRDQTRISCIASGSFTIWAKSIA